MTDVVSDKRQRHQLNIVTEEVLKPHNVANPLHASKKLWQSNLSREKLLSTIDKLIDQASRCELAIFFAELAECAAYIICGGRLGPSSVAAHHFVEIPHFGTRCCWIP